MSSITRITVLAILLVLPAHLVGQSDDKVSRLPWGAPDLQGVWLYWTATPLERPEEFADQAVVTPEEAAAYVAGRHERIQGEISGDWNPLAGFLNGRTSLIIDPPNGRLPARTEAGQYRADTIGRPADLRSADGPEDRDRWERCIMGHSVPFSPRPWDKRIQILQTQDHVAIQDEEGELRLIPVTDQARLPESIRQWAGNSRGHWATPLWSKRQTSTGSGRFTGPVHTCVSSSGSPAPLAGPSTTSSPSTTRNRLPARGPGRSHSLRIRVPSMRWPVTRGTAACRSFWAVLVHKSVRNRLSLVSRCPSALAPGSATT